MDTDASIPASSISGLSGEKNTMNAYNKNKQSRLALIALIGLMPLTVVAVSCFQSDWQPSGYRTSPTVCPERETDSRGYCFVHRDDAYEYLGSAPEIIHISRSSGPKGEDTISGFVYVHGKLVSFSHSSLDPYPPQNRVDAFVQSVRDRRTELYSDMRWPDPNPPAIPPLNR